MNHTHQTHEAEEHQSQTLSFGFWIYLMSDCFLFASLFATYAVLHDATAAGPTGRELFSLPFVLLETALLLTSSFTAGLSLYFAHHAKRTQTLALLGITAILGAAFLALEFSEFSYLVASGASWSTSAFLSVFFTLLGVHGAHVFVGIIWMLTLCAHIFYTSFTPATLRRLVCFGLFWHFLDIVWIFIFSFVYLMGVLN